MKEFHATFDINLLTQKAKSNQVVKLRTMSDDIKTQHEIDLVKSGTNIELDSHANEILRTKEIPKTHLVSAVNHVRDLMKDPKNPKFNVEKFARNPLLEDIIKKTVGPGYDPNTEIPLTKVQEITSLYMQKVMELQLRKAGKWEDFTESFSGYGDELKAFWNMERISQSFDVRGKNAMTIAGVTYGMTTLFGLGGDDSTWYKGLTNLSAYKKSAGERWKMFLSAGIGAQIAGVPLAETGGLIVRASLNTLSHVSYTGAELFANLFNPTQWAAIVSGKNIAAPTPEAMLSLLPSIKNYFKPEYQKLLSQFYESKTGNKLNIQPDEIDKIARLTIDTSQKLLNQGNGPDPMNINSWKQASIQSITDVAALSLARNPDPRIRMQFQKSVNKYINLQRAGKLKPLVGIIDDEKFNEDFEKGAKQILGKMSVKERKSVLQMASSYGLSGMLLMAWIFIQGSLLAVQGIMWAGGKALGEKKEDGPEVEKDTNKESALVELNIVLTKSSDEKIKTSKDNWGKLTKNLVKLGIIGGLSDSKLSKFKEDQKSELFKALSKNQSNLEKFTIKGKLESQDIKGMANTQKDIYDVLRSARVKVSDANLPMGVLPEKNPEKSERGKTLKRLIIKHKKLKEWKANKVKEWKLNPLKPKQFTYDNFEKIIKKAYNSAGVTKNPLKSFREAFRSPLKGLGIRGEFFNEMKTGNKANLTYIDKILSTTKEVIDLYESNNSGIRGKLGL